MPWGPRLQELCCLGLWLSCASLRHQHSEESKSSDLGTGGGELRLRRDALWEQSAVEEGILPAFRRPGSRGGGVQALASSAPAPCSGPPPGAPGDPGTQKLVILSPFDSGSHLLQRLLEANWPSQMAGACASSEDHLEGIKLPGHCRYVWKHSLDHEGIHRELERSGLELSSTVLLVIVRSPLAQLQAWRQDPWDLRDCVERPWTDMGLPCQADLHARPVRRHLCRNCTSTDYSEYRSTMDVYNKYLEMYVRLREECRFRAVHILEYERLVREPLNSVRKLRQVLKWPVPSDHYRLIMTPAKQTEAGDKSNGRNVALARIDKRTWLQTIGPEVVRLLCEDLDRGLANKFSDGSFDYFYDCRRALNSASADRQGSVKRALLVNGPRGPSRFAGMGVRAFLLIRDLIDCGYEVDVAVDHTTDVPQGRTNGDVFGWEAAKCEQDGSCDVAFFNVVKTDRTLTQIKSRLPNYDSIMLFDWNFAFEFFDPFIRFLESSVREDASMRDKIALFLDDVVTRRFPKNETIPRLQRLNALSHRVFALTDQDAKAIGEDIAEACQCDPSMGVWPLSLSTLTSMIQRSRRVLPQATSEGKYLTYVGNSHKAGRATIEWLFSSGQISNICDAIKDSGSAIRLVFVGTIREVVEQQLKAYPEAMPCILIMGIRTSAQMDQQIIPDTLAWFNPLYEDVKSGISIKSYEGIATGLPLITSRNALHGIYCDLPLVQDQRYDQFVIDNVLDDYGYMRLKHRFAQLASQCTSEQKARLTLSRTCSLVGSTP